MRTEYWYNNQKWLSAIKIITAAHSRLDFCRITSQTKQQSAFSAALFIPKLDKEEVLILMQQLGHKWHPRLKDWVYSHYLYSNRPLDIYTRPELREVGLAPAKKAYAYNCWNGRGYIPVYDIKDRRKLNKPNNSTVFKELWGISDLLLSSPKATVVSSRWGFFYLDCRIEELITKHKGFFIKKNETIQIGNRQLSRFKAYANIPYIIRILNKFTGVNACGLNSENFAVIDWESKPLLLR